MEFDHVYHWMDNKIAGIIFNTYNPDTGKFIIEWSNIQEIVKKYDIMIKTYKDDDNKFITVLYLDDKGKSFRQR